MTIQTCSNITTPDTMKYADADGDAYERATQLAAVAKNLDQHDHSDTKGLPVRRLQSAAPPAATGQVQIDGDDLKWWGGLASAIQTALKVGDAIQFIQQASAPASAGAAQITGNLLRYWQQTAGAIGTVVDLSEAQTLQNKTLDNTCTVRKVQTANAPAAAGEIQQTGELLRYFGTALREVVEKDQAQTLTNKTLDSTCSYGVTWTDWTPTISQGGSNPAVTVLEAKYAVIGEMLHYYCRLSVTGSGTSGQAIRILGWPIAPAEPQYSLCGYMKVQDTSGPVGYAGLMYFESLAPVRTQTARDADGAVGVADLGDTFALANGDVIQARGFYRIA